MKKLTAVLSPVAMVVAALTATPALAYTDQVMDPAQSYDSTVKKRQVNYTCQSNKRVSVVYGFNSANLPTYAEAVLNGKKRFLPLNLARTDNVDTVFGDEENFSIMSDAMRLNNYHRLSINVQNANSEIVFKGCNVRSVRRL